VTSDEEALMIVNNILDRNGIDRNAEGPLPPHVIAQIRAAAELAALRDYLVFQGR